MKLLTNKLEESEMKKNVILLVLFILLSYCGYSQYEETPTWVSGKHIMESSFNMMDLKNDLIGFSLRTDYISILTAYLRKESNVIFTTYLNSGNRYAFAGSGDDNATDVDIYLLNTEGDIVVKDASTSKNPIVYYSPSVSGNYTVKLKLYNSISVGCFCNLLMLVQGGDNIDIDDIKNALLKTIGACVYMHGINSDIKFFDNDNQWCMYGSVLKKGSSNAIENLQFGSEDLVFLAWGDENTTDIDLKISDKNGTVLCQDTESRDIAFCGFSTSMYSTYQLEYKNYASTGNAVVIAVVMTK